MNLKDNAKDNLAAAAALRRKADVILDARMARNGPLTQTEITEIAQCEEYATAHRSAAIESLSATANDDRGAAESYLNAEWYKSQTKEWDALSAKGWKFAMPLAVPHMVGIRMTRGNESATFHAWRELSREEINTRLLSCCKAFAEATSREDSTNGLTSP